MTLNSASVVSFSNTWFLKRPEGQNTASGHLQRVVDGRLGRVDDEVSQGEAEALGGSAQVERLRPRPGKGLLLGPGGGRRQGLALIASILLLRLRGGQTERRVSAGM